MNKKILLVSTITLLLDQLSKMLIDSFIKLNKSIPVIKNFFYITSCRNEGAAWGMFSNQKYIIVIGTIIAIFVIYRFIYSLKNNLRNNIAFGLLIGGLFGNLIDRLFFGYVRDFLDFYIFKYDYPVFNIADMAIVIGVFLLIISIFKGDDKNATSRK